MKPEPITSIWWPPCTCWPSWLAKSCTARKCEHSLCLFEPVCNLAHCSLSVSRGPLTDLRQTWWVYVGGPCVNCPWGVHLYRKGQRSSTGQPVSLITFHYIIYETSLTPHSCYKGDFAKGTGIPKIRLKLTTFFTAKLTAGGCINS